MKKSEFPRRALGIAFAEHEQIDIRKKVLRASKLVSARSEMDWVQWWTLVCQILVRPSSVDPVLDRSAIHACLGAGENEETRAVTLAIPIPLYRAGRDLRLVTDSGPMANELGLQDQALIRLLARGRRWDEQLASGERSSLCDVAEAGKLDERYV